MRKRKDEEEKNDHEIVVETIEPETPPVEDVVEEAEPEQQPEPAEYSAPEPEAASQEQDDVSEDAANSEVESEEPVENGKNGEAEPLLEDDLSVPLVLEGDVGVRMKKLEENNLRLRAEFANYKRRIERENIEFAAFLKGEIIKELLPVFDDFRLMIEKSSEGDNEQTLLEGARMIYGKLTNVLEREGLEKN